MPKNHVLDALEGVREALRDILVLDGSGIEDMLSRTRTQEWYDAVDNGWKAADAVGKDAPEPALRAVVEAARGIIRVQGAVTKKPKPIAKFFTDLQAALRRLSNVDRYGRPYELLEPWEYQRIRERGIKTDVEYGSVEEVVATGRAECRVCTERIEKGEPAYRFYWDFNGCGSWTSQAIQIHKRDCPSRLEAVKEAR